MCVPYAIVPWSPQASLGSMSSMRGSCDRKKHYQMYGTYQLLSVDDDPVNHTVIKVRTLTHTHTHACTCICLRRRPTPHANGHPHSLTRTCTDPHMHANTHSNTHTRTHVITPTRTHLLPLPLPTHPPTHPPIPPPHTLQSIACPIGYDVVTTTTGVEALDYLRDCKVLPDLVLLDCMMPEMDGFEVLRELAILFPHTHIPVIIVSAKVGGVRV